MPNAQESFTYLFCPLASFILWNDGGVRLTSHYSEAINSQISLATIYAEQGNLSQARMVLNQVLTEKPHSAAGWSAMGYLEEISGNVALATEYYRYAVKLSPKEGNLHNNFGIFLCRHQQQRAGIQELLTAAQCPSYVDRGTAYYNAARCAASIPDLAAAELYLNQAHQNGMAMGGVEPPTSAL